MYDEIINKVKEIGDQLPALAGNVKDIGIKKSDLTEWDLKIENELTSIIKRFPGDHLVFAEEISTTFNDGEDVWIMDPISNTFNFIYGLPHYSIVVSHLHKNEVVFAVIYDPSTRELFTAEKGKGAYLNGNKIQVSDRTGRLAIIIGPHLNPNNSFRFKLIKIIESLSTLGTLRTFGSVAIHYAYVACGRVDVAITKNSDVFPEFAGKLLVEEAGGKFTDFNNKDLAIYSQSILATNGKVHNKILEIITKIVSS